MDFQVSKPGKLFRSAGRYFASRKKAVNHRLPDAFIPLIKSLDFLILLSV